VKSYLFELNEQPSRVLNDPLTLEEVKALLPEPEKPRNDFNIASMPDHYQKLLREPFEKWDGGKKEPEKPKIPIWEEIIENRKQWRAGYLDRRKFYQRNWGGHPWYKPKPFNDLPPAFHEFYNDDEE
jgi:hypothetical protein